MKFSKCYELFNTMLDHHYDKDSWRIVKLNYTVSGIEGTIEDIKDKFSYQISINVTDMEGVKNGN